MLPCQSARKHFSELTSKVSKPLFISHIPCKISQHGKLVQLLTFGEETSWITNSSHPTLAMVSASDRDAKYAHNLSFNPALHERKSN